MLNNISSIKYGKYFKNQFYWEASHSEYPGAQVGRNPKTSKYCPAAWNRNIFAGVHFVGAEYNFELARAFSALAVQTPSNTVPVIDSSASAVSALTNHYTVY